jgi:glutaredoxin
VFHLGWRRRASAARAILPPALVLLLLCLPAPVTGAEPPDARPTDIEVFVREGCPHCAAAKRFLEDLQRERPGLRIEIRDIAQDAQAFARLHVLADRFGVRPVGVPAFLVRGELLVGFAGPGITGARLRALLDRPAVGSLPAAPSETDSIETHWFGRLSAREMGLPAFTLVLGLLDGFNPCAMWVLLFLLSLLVNLQDRFKMAVVASTFVGVSGLVYFAFMAAWLNLFLWIGLSRATQVLLGALGLFVGIVNIKDFFAFTRGISLGIPEAARPGIYAHARRIIQAEHLGGALTAVVVLAVLVNTVELLCTAGFPAVYTHILTMRALPWWKYYSYLGLYNLAYVFDDAIVVSIAVVTLSRRKLQERGGRWLKLVSGVVMAGLGAVLLARPQWLIW